MVLAGSQGSGGRKDASTPATWPFPPERRAQSPCPGHRALFPCPGGEGARVWAWSPYDGLAWGSQLRERIVRPAVGSRRQRLCPVSPAERLEASLPPHISGPACAFWGASPSVGGEASSAADVPSSGEASQMRPATGTRRGVGQALPRGAPASSWGTRSADSTSQEAVGARAAWGGVLVCTRLSEVCAPGSRGWARRLTLRKGSLKPQPHLPG